MYYLFNSDNRTVSNQGNTNDVASITQCKLFACVRPFLCKLWKRVSSPMFHCKFDVSVS